MVLISPFENGTAATLNWLFRRTSRFENTVAGLGDLLIAPVRSVARTLRGLLRLLVPRSLRNLLSNSISGLRRAGRRAGSRLLRIAEALNLDRFLFVVVRLTKPIWYAFAAFGTFVFAWAATRPYKKLLWGLPAVLLATPILVASTWGAYLGKEKIAERYRLAVAESLENKDYARVALLEKKLSHLGVNTQLSEFNTAQTLARNGKLSEAYERMRGMAPDDSPGYPLAHIWIIQNLLTDKLDVPADDAGRLAGSHLKQLSALGIKGPEVDMMRAAWLTKNRKLDEAAALLKPLVHRYPSAAVERLRINLSLNHRDQALLDASEVREHLQKRIQDGEPLTSHEYETWLAAEQLLNDTSEYRSITREWLKHFPESQPARNHIAAVSLQEFDEMLSTQTPDPSELSARLRTAYASAEVTQNIKDRVAQLYRQRGERQILQQLFDRLSPKQDLPAGLAETLGTAAATSGEWATAEAYLELAVVGDPKSAIAWNNLSCALLQKSQPPLEAALAAAQKACALQGEDFRFRETRGEILLRLHRWREAIDDLEFALNGLPDNSAIHRSLGKAYEAVGNKELADVHLQYAD